MLWHRRWRSAFVNIATGGPRGAATRGGATVDGASAIIAATRVSVGVERSGKDDEAPVYAMSPEVPPHVPEALVYDYDVFRPGAPGTDFFEEQFKLKAARAAGVLDAV